MPESPKFRLMIVSNRTVLLAFLGWALPMAARKDLRCSTGSFERTPAEPGVHKAR